MEKEWTKTKNKWSRKGDKDERQNTHPEQQQKLCMLDLLEKFSLFLVVLQAYLIPWSCSSFRCVSKLT